MQRVVREPRSVPMEPQIACSHCGARVRLRGARRVNDAVIVRCLRCGNVHVWPSTSASASSRALELHGEARATRSPCPHPWS